MNVSRGESDAGHRQASVQTDSLRHALATMSPPPEEWDNDDDFDLSSISGNALELPRSDAGSEDRARMGDENEASGKGVMSAAGGGGGGGGGGGAEDWDAEFADDEDQGDTIKVSTLTDATLAQLASMRKRSGGEGGMGLEGLAGKVTRLGAFPLSAHRMDVEGGGDWDEDLEVPETFPLLRPSRQTRNFASDLDLETPSLGSTSDATTSGSLPSDVRQRSLTHSSNAREPHSSVSSLSSSFASPTREVRGAFGEGKQGGIRPGPNGPQEEFEEDDFDLPSEVVKLIISPTLGRPRSDPSLDQEQMLWGEEGRPSPSLIQPASESGSYLTSQRKGDGEEEDDMLEGIDLPDQLFAKTKGETVQAAGRLQAKLEVRKKSMDGASGGSRKKWISAAENEFSQGLIITDDLDLSPSRLKAKKLSNRIREAAHQRRKSRDVRGEIGMTGGGKGVETASGSALPMPEELEKQEAGQTRNMVASTPSRLLASTAASRARERSTRCASPRPSPSVESAVWGRGTPTPLQDAPSSFSRPKAVTRRSLIEHSSERSESPLVGPSTPSRPYGSQANPHLRPTMGTAASRTRQDDSFRSATLSPANSPAVIRVMKGPKRARTYGDGKELDCIDDLPTTRERRDSSRTQGEAVGAQARQARKQQQQQQQQQQQLRDSPLPAKKQAAGPPTATKTRSRQSRRKQPTLIRNLGGPGAAPRVEGNMKWNPRLQRWEGNEEEGRSFENAVKGTGRPALITRLSVGSANVVLGWDSSKGSQVQPEPISPPPVGGRVVGDMIFDPVRLRWLNKNGEDEVDPFAAINDDTDDEDETRAKERTPCWEVGSGWIKSSHSSASLRTCSHADDPPPADQWSVQAINRALKGTRRERPDLLADRIPSAVWEDCLAAKTRHDEELAGFVPKRELPHGKRKSHAPSDRTGHLYLIQTLARKAMPD